ncbi:MAG: Lrp/AsnC family transcriptional regulator [Clostridia bacterium]|jgi:DNA-binding Lrp family transcriptional regulator|nr:Lrp/AsnC family transcriptional regulator [Clostridia bacterium]MDD4571490.1 Lrp/AsnC family transcriptional regulator [Clostridia bacterium]
MTIMDADDKKLINLLQQGLPLEEDPYAIIAGTMNKSKSEILARIKKLSQAGYIRRLGGTFDTNAMGFNSMLIGAHVPENIFYEVAEYINSYDNVTHNYRRSAHLNMWFTFTAKDEKTRTDFITALKEKFNNIEEVLEFPNLQNFKLHVFFDMESR